MGACGAPPQPLARRLYVPGRLEMVDQAVGRQRGDPGGQGVTTEGIARSGHSPPPAVVVDERKMFVVSSDQRDDSEDADVRGSVGRDIKAGCCDT